MGSPSTASPAPGAAPRPRHRQTRRGRTPSPRRRPTPERRHQVTRPDAAKRHRAADRARGGARIGPGRSRSRSRRSTSSRSTSGAAESETNRLLASGVTAIVTASPTPTLAAYPLAARARRPRAPRGPPHRPLPRRPAGRCSSSGPRSQPAAEVLAAHAWELGIGAWPLLAGGDDFGRAVRAAPPRAGASRGVARPGRERLARRR